MHKCTHIHAHTHTRAHADQKKKKKGGKKKKGIWALWMHARSNAPAGVQSSARAWGLTTEPEHAQRRKHAGVVLLELWQLCMPGDARAMCVFSCLEGSKWLGSDTQSATHVPASMATATTASRAAALTWPARPSLLSSMIVSSCHLLLSERTPTSACVAAQQNQPSKKRKKRNREKERETKEEKEREKEEKKRQGEGVQQAQWM